MLHVEEGAGFLLVYWRAGAGELHLSGGRRTVELDKEIAHLKILKLDFI